MNTPFRWRTGWAEQHVLTRLKTGASSGNKELNMNNTESAVEQWLARGQVMETSLNAGLAWRVERGMLLIRSPARRGDLPWRLALPGDWLNIEALCGLPQDTQTTALIASHLRALPALQQPTSNELLTRVVHQQRQWADNMLALRSGSVEGRISHLLDLVRQAGGGTRGTKLDMPVLRDIATLVDAAPETACRVMARLRPLRKAACRPVGAAAPALACI
jgi:hypothetical protein